MAINNSRSRAICFTLNNFTDDELEHLRLELPRNEYYVFQRERGLNGTIHIQGYCYCRNQRTLSAWKRVVGNRAHVEFARGTPGENREYCTKEETRVPGTEPEEGGRLPQQGNRSDLGAIVASIREGATDAELAVAHPGDFIRYSRGIAVVRQVFAPRRSWKTQVHWWYGPTGSGKTREAFERYPDAYSKMGTNKWWDGYSGNEVVIIDDYRRDMCTFAELLRLLDRYPMLVEVKGGTHQFVARTLIITTPNHPSQTWQGRSEEDLNQLFRRIDEIREFSYEGSTVVANPFTGGRVEIDARTFVPGLFTRNNEQRILLNPPSINEIMARSPVDLSQNSFLSDDEVPTQIDCVYDVENDMDILDLTQNDNVRSID